MTPWVAESGTNSWLQDGIHLKCVTLSRRIDWCVLYFETCPVDLLVIVAVVWAA